MGTGTGTGNLLFFWWYRNRYRKNLVPKKIPEPVSKKIWYRKNSRDRSRNQYRSDFGSRHTLATTMCDDVTVRRIPTQTSPLMVVSFPLHTVWHSHHIHTLSVKKLSSWVCHTLRFHFYQHDRVKLVQKTERKQTSKPGLVLHRLPVNNQTGAK